MSKNRDYTRYAKGPTATSDAVVSNKPEETAVVDVAISEIEVEDIIEQEPQVSDRESIIGMVTDCARLNVREHPTSNATVLGVITADTELIVIEEESTEDFYKICTSAGLEGYCVKRFITILP